MEPPAGHWCPSAFCPVSLLHLFLCRPAGGRNVLTRQKEEHMATRMKFATFKLKMSDFWMINLSNMCLLDRSGFAE